MESQIIHPIQRRKRDSVITVDRLIATYPCNTTIPLQGKSVSRDAVLSLLSSKETDQLTHRLCCYAFAQVKGQRLSTVIPDPIEVQKRVRELGSRWEKIITHISRSPPYKLTGIIVILGERSLWERAKTHTWQAALTNLSKSTDMIERAKKLTPSVQIVIGTLTDSLFNHRSTVAMSKVELRPSYVWNTPAVRVHSSPTTRSYHTKSASQLLQLERARAHADTNSLLTLLCFLNNSILPLDLLRRGSTSRRRWNDNGSIENVDGLQHGLSSVVVSICSTKLDETLRQLESFPGISKTSEQTIRLDKSLAATVISNVPIELHSFWRQQALIIACRSIPWKYLEHRPFNVDLYLPHIRHTLQEAQNNRVFEKIPPAIKTDLALSIIEASRFPDMGWKRFAISQSKILSSDVQDEYVKSYITQRESLLHRVATGPLFQPFERHETVPGLLSKKLHSGAGHGIIQRALDNIQLEDLTKAAEVLAAWEPISSPSSMETVVLFRKHVIMGKIERYRGDFKESLEHLLISKTIVEDHKDIVFHEDSGDLVCSLADTYLELEDPVAAERCLREQIAQQGESATILNLALAESLFAQGRLFDAKAICTEVKSLPKLLKMERLRLSIVLAKLEHINANYDEALGYWTDAMAAISRYNLANGHTTRIILLSMFDILRKTNNLDTETKLQSQFKTQEQLEIIEGLAKPAGVFYWIGGLRHWLKYLESVDRSRL